MGRTVDGSAPSRHCMQICPSDQNLDKEVDLLEVDSLEMGNSKVLYETFVEFKECSPMCKYFFMEPNQRQGNELYNRSLGISEVLVAKDKMHNRN